MTNVGKWNRWYGLVDPDRPEAYGDSSTYRIAADFVEGLAVSDWGCGKGWLRRFVPPELYHGVDGSASPFADEIADLSDYRTPSPAIVLRHVLEHDYRWRTILANAAAAAGARLVVVLFTPTSAETHELAWNPDPGVPDLSFAVADLVAELEAFEIDAAVDFPSPETQYGVESVLLCERRPA